MRHFILYLAFAIAATLFIYFSFNPRIQRDIIYVTAGSYFLWSLYHHYQVGDLHLSIIIEYLVFIVLALVVLSATFLFS